MTTFAVSTRVAPQPMQAVFPVSTANWSSSWIGMPDDPTPSAPNTWLACRRTLELQQTPRRAVARIAADSKYWLYINGKLVVFEGALKRGPTPEGTWYDVVDLTHRIGKGSNTIAVLVWHFGKEGYCHKNSGKAGFLFELDVDASGSTLRSDSRWRVTRHPAYLDTGGPQPNYRLPESNIRFDARRDLAGWLEPDFDDADWPHAAVLSNPHEGPWGRLYERPIPQWHDSGLRHDLDVERQQMPDGSSLFIGRLPYNAQVTPWIDVEGPAGSLIDIRMDNYVGGSEPNLRAEYVTREGRQTYESLGWMNGHAIHVLVPEGVTVHALGYRETGYATQQTGSFSCDDTRLNTLWQKSARTLYVNLRDTMFDSPDRERAQWWGDTVLEMTQGFYGFDRRIDRLTRKAILELAAWQKPDGVLYSPIPAGNYSDELPQQMLASVGWYGFWSYYLFTGDADTIARVYPSVSQYMQLWSLDADGLVAHRDGGWPWADWGDNIDTPLLDNAWYALALRAQAKMAQLIGQHEDLPAIEHRLKSVATNFERVFWDGTGLRSADHGDNPYDDRGQALAYLAGLTRPEHQPALLAILQAEQWASPYMEKYVLEAMLRMGAIDAALDRMRQRYDEMIVSPITTLWEGWELNTAKYGGGTYNHAWSGGPMELLSRYVAGIEPIEPNWRRFGVNPRLGSLLHLSVTVPTEPEPIHLVARREDRQVSGTLTVPEGHEAVLPPHVHAGVADKPSQPCRQTTAPLPPGTWRFLCMTTDA
ncbi:alpha-L-rhamnosidase-related protein [Mucisphaera calidilacus]|uniref:Bacterial alpha-L-rhamnosidase n=1 Tax=Mucisphaera calidilacus TaxID=2527982 RepID=A0A518BX22_9BACT|nr:alpha-L-rhamnosidase N-terminal domain-containing protein [Mucisphaera calidilacus]QDU71527.1 Bacterial alpha-L-rhamnosidase [Mucisphaera calidilacus]